MTYRRRIASFFAYLVAGASIKTITSGLLWGSRFVGRIEVSKAELKLWPPSSCRDNVYSLVKGGMGLPIGEYPGLLIGLVRVGFCKAPALGVEQDQSDQPTHPWVFLKTLHVPGVARASASMGYLGAAVQTTLWCLSVLSDWLDAHGSDGSKV
jgi:hypothetical protein